MLTRSLTHNYVALENFFSKKLFYSRLRKFSFKNNLLFSKLPFFIDQQSTSTDFPAFCSRKKRILKFSKILRAIYNILISSFHLSKPFIISNRFEASRIRNGCNYVR